MISRLALALAALVALGGCTTATSDKAMQRTLNEHPDIVLDALGQRKAALYAMVLSGQQEAQEAEQQKRQSDELRKPLKPVIDPARAMRGPANAPVTVVVYSDFLCPYCARGAEVLKEFMTRHPDSVRVLFKHFALDELSRKAALLYEALAKQDPKLAFAFHDAVFEAQDQISQAGEPGLFALAIKLGANVGKLKRDLKDPALPARIDADVAEARAFGIEGTPTFLVNGVSVRGAVPVSDFESVLRKVDNADGEAPCDTCNKKKK